MGIYLNTPFRLSEAYLGHKAASRLQDMGSNVESLYARQMTKCEREINRKGVNMRQGESGLLTARRSWACMYSSTSWRPVTAAKEQC